MEDVLTELLVSQKSCNFAEVVVVVERSFHGHAKLVELFSPRCCGGAHAAPPRATSQALSVNSRFQIHGDLSAGVLRMK